jgi:hypothetical protein
MPLPIESNDAIRYLDLRQIHLNRLQLPSLIDHSWVRTLADDILKVGRLLHEPIGRPLRDMPGHVELASGVHRYLAFKLLHDEHPQKGFGVMPVKVAEMSDVDFYQVMWMGNHQRRMSPLERGMWLVSMLESEGMRQVDLESVASLSQQSISVYVRVTKAPKWLRDAIHEGYIGYKLVSDLQHVDACEGMALYEKLKNSPEDARVDIVRRFTARVKANRPVAVRRRSLRRRALDACPHCGQVPRQVTLVGNSYVCGECDGQLRISLQFGVAHMTPTERATHAPTEMH